jgi:hypothetical protein
MKLISLATMAVATMATTAAFAAKSNTEYYFQPAAGASAVELRYNMDIRPAQIETPVTLAVTDAKSETNDFYLNYAYGLNESNALGAFLTSGSTKLTVGTSSSTGSGLGDLHLFYKGFAEMWHYGVDLGFSTEKIKNDAAGNVSNHSSGGNSLKANIGMLMNSAAWNYGADLSYIYLLERTIDGSTTKYKDGNTVKLAPFIEYNYGMGFLGAELSYAMAGDTTSDTGGTTYKIKGDTSTGLALNGSFDFNEMATGLLTVGMNMHGAHDSTDQLGTTKVKAYTETVASLGVRLNF